MEVKIKNQNELIDATIEMVDGVMVVSPKEVKFEPKEVKFEPKEGDVITIENKSILFTLIVKSMGKSKTVFSHALLFNNESLSKDDFISYENLRPATEEEKQKLFQAIADNWYKWDAEKKQLVKLMWKPSVGQLFYYPEYDNRDCAFIIKAYTYAFEDQIERDKAITKDWCFKTSKECQEFCDRLNEAIETIKP